MQVQRVAESQIRAMTDPSTFSRGRTYFHEGRVIAFWLDPDTRAACAMVRGSRDYRVSIGFDVFGHVYGFECECEAFRKYDGPCKHVVAVLFRVQEQSGGSLKDMRNREALSNLFGAYAGEAHPSLPAQRGIRIVPTLFVRDHVGDPEVSAEFSVGAEHLYVVRDVPSLLRSCRENRLFSLGKKFTLNPAGDSFDEQSSRILELLLRVGEPGYWSEPGIHGRQCRFSLPTFDAFFEILKEKPINAGIHGTQTVTMVDGEIPLSYEVGLGPKGIEISSRQSAAPLRLFKHGNYLYHDGIIYRVPWEQMNDLAPFLHAMSLVGGRLSVPDAEASLFFSSVLPVIKRITRVHVHEDLKEKVVEAPLTTRVYFDRKEDGITAQVEFDYAGKCLDPLAEGAGHEDSEAPERLVLRDRPAEQKILSLLHEAGFAACGNLLFLADEQGVYEFITAVLPKLRELCEVHYSEELKKVRVSHPRLASSVRLTDQLDLLEVSFAFDVGDDSDWSGVLASIRLRKKYHRLADGSFISLEDPAFDSMSNLLTQLDLSDRDLAGKTAQIPKYRALYIDALLRDSKSHFMERSSMFKQMVQNIREPEDMEFEIPGELRGVLRDYQRTGFKWLKTLAFYGMGGILADDMGLGKTLQVIAFIQSERAAGAPPAIVVAPKSLLYNWQDEVQKFAPSLKARVINGPPGERRSLAEGIMDEDIIITSYSLLRSDIELYRDRLFSYCFLDEAQHIKNPETINAKTVKMLKARGYFALTGTPIENSLTELWSIFDFLMPGFLLSHSKFLRRFEVPIVKNGDQGARSDLARHIRPFILRRLKRDVLKELPEKIESKATAELTEEQKRIYLAYLQEARSEVAAEIEEKGLDRSQIKILALLTRLRQICCHPGMFVEGYEGGSGKMQILMELVTDALQAGHRILLFSQFTSALALIRKELDAKKIGYFYLDGSVSSEERMMLVRDFNAGTVPVFLISLRAGGTGLNLTGADVVIHFDPWWNPAVEEQATDRAYRIGQQNVVQVFKLIAQGTIEEKIFALQQRKRELIDSVIQPGEAFLTRLSQEEVHELFEIG